MDLSKITQNKNILYSVIAAIGIVIILIALIIILGGHGNSGKPQSVGDTPLEKDVVLLETDSVGKALEVQSLLAKQGIIVDRDTSGGTKSSLKLMKKNCSSFTKKACTVADRDKAIITIVQSGLIDKNIGLEIFDKGDFTSTKEDKRIRLARAMNGELARLIKQLPKVENASVFISIPEKDSMFDEQKPRTATVQVVLARGDKLDQNTVKAITNLLLGSVAELEAENIAVTDTNGNTYHSVMDAKDEILQKLEENDRYMQQKISRQLDRLVGPGNYVATVSTFLRQTPVERFSIEYDPQKKAAVSEQSFSEGLGDKTQDQTKGINAVSVYLPNGLPTTGMDSSQDRNYTRQATETQYGVTKVQTNEYIRPGVVEDVSIAVTLDRTSMPQDLTTEELRSLIARAASPKVSAANVSIAYTNSADPYLSPEKQHNLPKVDETGNPWWLAIIVTLIGVIITFWAVSRKVRQVKEENEVEVEALRQRAMAQEQQLNDINNRAAQLTQRQSELAQDLINQQQLRGEIPQFDENLLLESLDLLSSEINEDAADNIKSWIEEGSGNQGAPQTPEEGK